jgi:hypothetical protein
LQDDGTIAESWANNLDIRHIFPLADRKLLVMGPSLFRGAAAEDQRQIARVHQDGTLDLSFEPLTVVQPSSPPVTAAVTSEGQILVMGGFYGIQDAAGLHVSRRIARLHADGRIDRSFATDAAPADNYTGHQIILVGGKAIFTGGFSNGRVYAGAEMVIAPRLVNPRWSENDFYVDLQSMAGRTYVLEFKDGLALQPWTLGGKRVGDGGRITLRSPTEQGIRFFRVRVE